MVKLFHIELSKSLSHAKPKGKLFLTRFLLVTCTTFRMTVVKEHFCDQFIGYSALFATSLHWFFIDLIQNRIHG